MASPAADIGPSHQHHPVTDSAADSAFQEAQKWIEVSAMTNTPSRAPSHCNLVLWLWGFWFVSAKTPFHLIYFCQVTCWKSMCSNWLINLMKIYKYCRCFHSWCTCCSVKCWSNVFIKQLNIEMNAVNVTLLSWRIHILTAVRPIQFITQHSITFSTYLQ